MYCANKYTKIQYLQSVGGVCVCVCVVMILKDKTCKYVGG